MDLNKVLAELIRERDLLDDAIAHLERLAADQQGVSRRLPRSISPGKRQQKVQTASAGLD
jgi:hypothetical protein